MSVRHSYHVQCGVFIVAIALLAAACGASRSAELSDRPQLEVPEVVGQGDGSDAAGESVGHLSLAEDVSPSDIPFRSDQAADLDVRAGEELVVDGPLHCMPGQLVAATSAFELTTAANIRVSLAPNTAATLTISSPLGADQFRGTANDLADLKGHGLHLGSFWDPEGLLDVSFDVVADGGEAWLLNHLNPMLLDLGTNATMLVARSADGVVRLYDSCVGAMVIHEGLNTMALDSGKTDLLEFMLAYVVAGTEQRQTASSEIYRAFEPDPEPLPLTWEQRDPTRRSLIQRNVPEEIRREIMKARIELAAGPNLLLAADLIRAEIAAGNEVEWKEYAVCPRQRTALAGYCVSISSLVPGDLMFVFAALPSEKVEIWVHDEATPQADPLGPHLTYDLTSLPGRLVVDLADNFVETHMTADALDLIVLTPTARRFPTDAAQNKSGIPVVGGADVSPG